MIAIRSTSVILLSTWILTAVVATNYSLMFAFFAEYSESRHIPIEKYSYVFGIGDGAYIIGVFLYPLCKKFMLKNFLFAAFLISIVCNLLFSFCHLIEDNDLFIVTCLILRMISRISLSITAITSYSIMTIRFTNQMATVLSLIEMAFVIGQSSGPMIGGFMYAHFGYSAPFLVLTVINFMAYLITILATYNDTSKVASDNDLTIRKIFSRKSMYWLFILYIVDGITVNFYSAMFASYLLNEFLLKAETIGMILASGAVFNSLIGFVTGYLLDRGYYSNRATVHLLLVLVVGFIMIAPPVNLSHTSRIVISIMGFFVLVPGNVVNYMYQVYRSYEEILSLGYSKDDVIVYLAFSALVFSGYSCGFMASGLGLGHVYKYFGFQILAYTLGFITLIIWITISSLTKETKKWTLNISNIRAFWPIQPAVPNELNLFKYRSFL